MTLWWRSYVPARGADRLAGHGDYAETRQRFYSRPHSNLRFLIRERYEWMRPHLSGRERIVELGAGPGLSRDILGLPGLEVTDVLDNPWLDRQVDAMALPYPPGSLDAVICSHMIHHVPSPAGLIRSIQRVLKPRGVLLINESTASLCHRLLMRIMRHEGWSYDIDVFDDSATTKAAIDPLAGNNAVADLLFDDHERFTAAFPGLTITRDEFTELFVFVLSGGVGGRVFTVELPARALEWVRAIDRALTENLPGVFALARRLVVVKQA
jgi:SAM-dependent methyltransferase